jgi:diacylglycerol kinase family enzyme
MFGFPIPDSRFEIPASMSIAIIINPISGSRGHRATTGAARADLARRLVTRLDRDAEIVVTREPGHGVALSREFAARGVQRVIGWGGDGTINEIAGPLLGTATTLGIVPSGSGDGLARSLGLPRQPEAALTTAVREPAVPIDVGFLGGRHFLNIAGIGFDAAVGHGFNRGARRGVSGYLKRGLSLAWTYGAERYDLRLGDETRTGRWFLAAFANGSQYGNGLMLAADADPCDGWLNAVVVDAGPPLRQFWRARRLFFRRFRPAEGVHRYRVKSASVTGDHLVCHVDGETFETRGTIEVRIDARKLLVAGLRG